MAEHLSGDTSFLSAALEVLHESSWRVKEPALQLLLKLLQNIINAPENPKFRCIKRTNATLQAKVFSVAGCTDVLLAAGFKHSGAEELMLSDGVDVKWVVDGLTAFFEKEHMAHQRAERDARIAAARAADGDVAKQANASSAVSEERRLLLRQLEIDKQERREQEQLQTDGFRPRPTFPERASRTCPSNVIIVSASNAKVKKGKKSKGWQTVSSSGSWPTHGSDQQGTDRGQKDDDIWKLGPSKKKKGKKGKKGNGKGSLAANQGQNNQSSTSGMRSGYKPIEVSTLTSCGGRNLDHISAAAVAAEGRRDYLEEWRVLQQQRKQSELQALAAYRKSSKSLEVAKACQQAAAETAAAPVNLDLLQPAEISTVEVHQVPADNSCLFHSVAYLIQSSSETLPVPPQNLRILVATVILQEQSRWNEVTMAENRSVEAYGAWITNSSSWGGFVDLIVLSECYQIQISVISTESLYWTHYPEDESMYNRRIYLLYDGVHYDAVVGQSSVGEVRIFSSTDSAVMQKVASMASEVQQSGAQWHVALFSCMECREILYGDSELSRHCFETGHQRFAEVSSGDESNADIHDEDGGASCDDGADSEDTECETKGNESTSHSK